MHVKELAVELAKRLADPFDYPDMNDGSVDWAAVYAAMRQAWADEDHGADALLAGLVALGGFDPHGD